jgi:hypothetical protein
VIQEKSTVGEDGSRLWGWTASLVAKLGRQDLADRSYFLMREQCGRRGRWNQSSKVEFSGPVNESGRNREDGVGGFGESGQVGGCADRMTGEEGIASIIRRMDSWLESMRHPEGYGGPVVHWWRDCLSFTGAGLDWRYEGIMLGYLHLFRATGRSDWLEKASRAGNNLIEGQLPSGRYRNSSFELNPKTGGNPHEAACDLGLFHLALELRQRGYSSWERYYLVAEKNLQAYILGDLWDPENGYFRNGPIDATFVPNKAATIAEALMARARFSSEADILERFVIPTLDKILACQVHSQDHRLEGAIDQGWLGCHSLGRYFPFYIARCIPALIQGFRYTGYERYRQAAWLAAQFLLRHQLEDGSFPQVIYHNGRINRYPQWIAGVGDILRAMDLMEEEGMDVSPKTSQNWLVKGLLPNGAIRTAKGFGSYWSQRTPSGPDLRDLIPVCGWVDKAFRYLARNVEGDFKGVMNQIPSIELGCSFRGHQVLYRETSNNIECWEKNQRLYHWRKGEDYAKIIRI